MLLSSETCGSAASTGVGVFAARPPRMWCTVLRLGRRLVSSPLVMLCLLYLRLSRETCGSTSNVLRSQCSCLKVSSVDLAQYMCAQQCTFRLVVSAVHVAAALAMSPTSPPEEKLCAICRVALDPIKDQSSEQTSSGLAVFGFTSASGQFSRIVVHSSVSLSGLIISDGVRSCAPRLLHLGLLHHSQEDD